MISKSSSDDVSSETVTSNGKTEAQNLITLPELLDQQSSLESEVAEVLPFDCSHCTRSLGPLRQAVYSCLTCNPPKSASDGIPSASHVQAGVCSACSVSCHADHQLVELFVRRNFLCDCGTTRCNPGGCELRVEEEAQPARTPESKTGNSAGTAGLIGHANKYDHNFDGQFCICERGKTYDPETETEDMYQCLACEDWRHASCLGPYPDPESWDDLICAKCVQENATLRTMLNKHAGGVGTGMMICAGVDVKSIDSTVKWHGRPNSLASLVQSKDQYSASVDPEAVSTNISADSTSAIPSQTDPSPVMDSTKRHQPECDVRLPPEKRARLDDCLKDRVQTCMAPFKTSTDSLLAKVDPLLANVFMAPGWRQKWCRCLECLKTLSEISWLGTEEEDVWEPADDQDSAKSLLELGMEAFKNLPQEQKVEGLHAYNKLRDHMMEFLRPFSEKGLTVTEDAIKDFFALEKEKIKKKVW
ncbi:hypothetical protein CROQUDRAFT_52917 [Cronartium quercuum f. sp. fusiforme G11]|uniref:UBR-type domain-containing protein n=1 Tax=Cronartium quercuum f. sp. fusiforme G11 TaxID=708437 RepID=A0A9P6N7X1_9BASI|nr:hypothetical protein CROQUDRAFT_52917 [Cronartium quercuum f. sp. fusiforme G11]